MNIFITGTSSGIGWGLTKHFLAQGHHVYGVSRRVPSDLISSQNYTHLTSDLSQFDKAKLELDDFLQNLKTIDLAILNAGILGEISDLKHQSIDQIKKVMDINVWSNKMVIDSLTKNVQELTKVVAISSGASKSGNRGWGAYSLSKSSLNMLIQLYANENNNTAFYSFAPGLVDTAMQDYLCSGDLNTKTFPSAQKLIDARNTEYMPSAEVAGEILAAGMEKLDQLPSGSFADIRQLN
jgi:NAD(P)-dependent dehydrogenase (short-subunit alcohol dehydrogenase family)